MQIFHRRSLRQPVQLASLEPWDGGLPVTGFVEKQKPCMRRQSCETKRQSQSFPISNRTSKHQNSNFHKFTKHIALPPKIATSGPFRNDNLASFHVALLFDLDDILREALVVVVLLFFLLFFFLLLAVIAASPALALARAA